MKEPLNTKSNQFIIKQASNLVLAIPVMASQQRLAAICTDRKGKVLGKGTNSYTRSHPLQKHFAVLVGYPEEKVYLHAELQAILKCKDKQIHALYVARALKDGTISLAKPCESCIAAIKAFGIEKVVYTITDKCYAELSVENL